MAETKVDNNQSQEPQDGSESFSEALYSSVIGAPTQAIKKFLKMEASGGILLVIAAVLAMIVANTPFQVYYHYFLEILHFRIGFFDAETGLDMQIKKPILLWINDGLMAIFFFLVGLEIKREVVSGELASAERAILPIVAAVGGVLAPALVYYFFNQGDAEAIKGWAIPAATDIAFALGVLSLLGSRVPTSLKVLLTAIAIIDDLAAILIIAFFYTASIKAFPLVIAAVCVGALFFINVRKVSNLSIYIVIGLVLWAAVLKSGVHATLAGVVIAMFIPMTCSKNKDRSPLMELDHILHPWVAFAILPIFAFANAGVTFHGMTWADAFNPVSLGIAMGLIVGKQVGIFSLMVLCIKFGFSPKPLGTNWMQLYAVSILCGIGFTMSLFIGGLSFDSPEMQVSVRIGVILASVVSAILGVIVLLMATDKEDADAKIEKMSEDPEPAYIKDA